MSALGRPATRRSIEINLRYDLRCPGWAIGRHKRRIRQMGAGHLALRPPRAKGDTSRRMIHFGDTSGRAILAPYTLVSDTSDSCDTSDSDSLFFIKKV